MKSETRYILLFFILLLLVIVVKFVKEYSDIQNTYEQIATHEASSLNHMVQAFSHSYSALINHMDLPLNTDNIQLRPVMRLPEVSKIFSEMSDTNIILRTVSKEPMNPENKATAKEAELIEFFLNNPLETEKLVQVSDEEFIYSNVLRANIGCLTCHGNKTESPKVVRDSYFNGYGFKLNDVLGIRAIYYKNTIRRIINIGPEIRLTLLQCRLRLLALGNVPGRLDNSLFAIGIPEWCECNQKNSTIGRD